MGSLLNDIRYGIRGLLKQPVFTAIAVLTLALGIGANTAIFSVVQSVLLRPLPFPEQERVIVGWKQDPTIHNPFVELSVAEINDWKSQSQSFSGLAAMPTTVYGYGYVLTGRGEPVQLESAKVTGQFFSILGGQAALGRVFDESDDRVNGPNVVVLSDHLWRERFSSDPHVVGQTITLNNNAFTVLGVMPASFTFPKGVDVWIPLLAAVPPKSIQDRGANYLQMIGRLKPGTTLAQAEAEINTIIARLALQYPETQATNHRVVLTPIATHLFGSAKPALWALFAATGLLLLIAAANIANLLLARATRRRREFAIRTALGASRFRIFCQLLSESAMLAVCGSVLGLLVGYWLIDLLVAIAPADLPRLEEVRLSGTAMLVALCSMFVTLAVFGLLPALSVSRFNLNETLSATSNKLMGAHSSRRLRGMLVVGEIALTLVLLAGATLILRSFVNLSRVPLGLDPNNVLTMQLRLRGDQYTQLIERLEAQPGVVSASGVLTRPLEGTVGWDWNFALEGQSSEEARRNPDANFEVVHPHYFTTFGIPLKAGRTFEPKDKADHQAVAIVSETLAETYFGSAAGALGKRLKLGSLDSEGSWKEIVGVVGDVRYRALQDARLDLYVPFAQWRWGFLNHFGIRSTLPTEQVLALVRREVAAIDPTLAVSRVVTMDELVAAQLARPRFNAALLNWLSALAVALAGIGIYGVLAYTVAERTSELGIRLALGAQTQDILKLVIGQGMVLVATGIAIGLVASFALTRLLTNLLFGVSATDPLTFSVIAVVFALVGLLACYFPARRATKVDPLMALRSE
jgi:putative ABC transport system permease protein